MSVVASVTANCWLAAASMFNIPPALLYAIAEVESSFNPRAVANANNGTYSIGVMQINSTWFPVLESAGITEASLYEPCVSIHVGAWILAQEIERYGYTWEAIGAYYAGPYDERSHRWKVRHYREYASKVLRAWTRLNRRSGMDVHAR
jgi:soluble lytic murein transglycosylase-like protein